jgi:hypothetical protein
MKAYDLAPKGSVLTACAPPSLELAQAATQASVHRSTVPSKAAPWVGAIHLPLSKQRC